MSITLAQGATLISGSGSGATGNTTYADDLSTGMIEIPANSLAYSFDIPYGAGTAYQVVAICTSGTGTYTIAYNGATIGTVVSAVSGSAAVVIFNTPVVFAAGGKFTATRSSGSDINCNITIGLTYNATGAITPSYSPIISKQFNLASGANPPDVLDSSAAFGYTINSLNGLKTSSGTITVSIQINGTNVTGLTNLAVTSIKANYNATALNTVNVNDRVTVVTASNSSAVSLEFTFIATRTS